LVNAWIKEGGIAMNNRFGAELKPLFYERGNLSLGRVVFWILFLIDVSYFLVGLSQWIGDHKSILDIPAGLMYLTVTTLGYNLVKKWAPEEPKA
jgi:hypothetical protein